ncbi:MAG: hypothetical protein P8Y02_15610, partial [Deinococcales bacterium]
MASARSSRRSAPRRRRRSLAARAVSALLGVVWALMAGFPVYYMVITSLKTQAGFFNAPLGLPPRNPTLANYHRVVFSEGITHDFLNSVIVTAASVAVALVLSMLVAYVIVRIDRRWVRWTLNLFL